MMLRIEIYCPFFTLDETRMFFVWRRRRITSRTVVLRTEVLTRFLSAPATVIGVYPVIKKWHLGVGINEATSPIRSLFMYPGYLNVVVLAHIIVDTI